VVLRLRGAARPGGHDPGGSLKARLVSVAALRPKVSDDLEWFFNMAECDMGDQSNYLAMLGLDGPGSGIPSPEDAAEAVHRHRRIRDRLLSIADSDAGVLQCAYEHHPWPQPLVRRFGHLTGVIVRLACALDYWPEDRREQRVLEMVRAEWLVPECVARVGRTLPRLRTEAEARLSRASAAFEATRRRG